MKTVLHCLFGLALSATSGADVFVQVNFEGFGASQTPPGQMFAGTVPFGYSGKFSVWVWGSGGDTMLKSISFDIGDGLGWRAESIGMIDPLNHFSGFAVKDPGKIAQGQSQTFIDNVLLGVITGPMVPLPQASANAMMIYQGFTATNTEVFGLIRPESVKAETNKGAAIVHSSGIVETPAPGSAVALLGAAWFVRRRR